MRPMGTAPLCRMIAAAMVIACVGGCGRSNRDTAADETGAAAAQVRAAAADLSRQAEMLRAQVDEFLAGVRAA